jgi:uncharacterized membrane protein HdeD (DUF308 family)
MYWKSNNKIVYLCKKVAIMFLFSSSNSTRILIKGIITTAVGVIIIAIPDLSIDTVIKFLGILMIVDGVINLLPSLFKKTKQQNVFVLVPRGTTSIFGGAILLLFPQLIVGIFVFFVGLILLIAGGSQIISLLVRKSITASSWLILLISTIAVFVGGFMLLFPNRIGVAIVIVTGILIALYGIGEIVWSFRVRKQQKQNPPAQPDIVDAEYEEVE